MSRKHYEYEKLFPSFKDRLPLRDNPAYPEYCESFGVNSKETNELILLSTIGSRGPSSLVFEPDLTHTFTGQDLKKFRLSLNLSTREFASCFGFSQAAIVRIEGKKESGQELLKLVEIFHRFPETAIFHIKKYAVKLHSKKKQEAIKLLLSGQK